uniref:Uncharacterized protein n=1 Tax=Acrobeloides nanus TaxID=290746 RepID=A0A914DKW7_9BILA
MYDALCATIENATIITLDCIEMVTEIGFGRILMAAKFRSATINHGHMMLAVMEIVFMLTPLVWITQLFLSRYHLHDRNS